MFLYSYNVIAIGMGKTTTIAVIEETAKVLAQMKLDNNLDSIEDVILGLIKGMEKAIKR